MCLFFLNISWDYVRSGWKEVNPVLWKLPFYSSWQKNMYSHSLLWLVLTDLVESPDVQTMYIMWWGVIFLSSTMLIMLSWPLWRFTTDLNLSVVQHNFRMSSETLTANCTCMWFVSINAWFHLCNSMSQVYVWDSNKVQVPSCISLN